MFQDVPTLSKILEGFHKLTPSGFRPLTPEMQATLDDADKPKKGGTGSKKGVKKVTAMKGPYDATKPSPKKRKAPTTSSTVVLKRRKQPARKRKTPTPSASEESDSEIELDEEIVNPKIPVHNEEDTTNQEINQSIHDSVPSPPPSPKTTSIPIIIDPCSPLITLSQPTTVPISITILTNSTTKPITSMILEVTLSVSDTGAKTFVFTTPISSSISPICNDDPDMIFGDDGDDDDLGVLTYSPFQIRTEREDEAQFRKVGLKVFMRNSINSF
ncbi:unnamed protein product [Lactuca saligna]|uniref:Uncharacterized protein n=1 Tax=Lactuca saligna TaxID=75948 RepID=A0AA36A345_LACSI|nr:unnamed protein product [Lactuca saligna]